MAKPARPELIFRSIDEMLADVARLRAGPYQKAGQWDLGMILDHLGKAMTVPPVDQKPVPWPINIVARALIRRMAKRQFYPPFKFPAPKGMRPTPNIPLESAEPMFRAAAEKLKSLPGPTISDTPFGTLALDDFVKLQLLHGAHHLSFLRCIEAPV
jgi:hypothetical protein